MRLAPAVFAFLLLGCSGSDDSSSPHDTAPDASADVSGEASADSAADASADSPIEASADSTSDSAPDAAPDTAPACQRTIVPCTPPSGPVFQQSFDDAASVQGDFTQGPYALETGFGGSGKSLAIDNPSGSSQTSVSVQHVFPANQLKWTRAYVSVRVKAQNVSDKPASWNGIKVMLALEHADGTKSWPQIAIGTGTFDWTVFTSVLEVPSDLVSAKLILGLEAVTGKVWFDDFSVQLLACGPTVQVDPACPIDKGHVEPGLRGFMISPWPDDATRQAAVSTLQSWGANNVRWQLSPADFADKSGLNHPQFDAVVETGLSRLDAALPLLKQAGIRVIVDLHNLSLNWDASEQNQTRFVEAWKSIAQRYAADSTVWAYDLANEPFETQLRPGLLVWEQLVEKTGKAIGAIDSSKAIIVEPSPGGGPSAIRNLYPIDLPNVIYSVHMYEPGAFTHQQVLAGYDDTTTYPGTIQGKAWDKAVLAEALAPVFAFQNLTRSPIYIGEFSAVRWAPGAAQYLTDVMDLFEGYGWDWSYHAFREWDGWDLECPSDKSACTGKVMTDRQQAVRTILQKNLAP